MDQADLDAIGADLNRFRVKAHQGLDGNKDDAAEAVQLEKTTGTDASVIYGNKDEFVRGYKGFLTDRMLDRNPGIAEYINAHPMAAIVSKDDWNRMADFYDHLDYYTQYVSSVPHVRALKGLIGGGYGFLKAYEEAFWGQPAGAWMQGHPETAEFIKKHPLIGEAAKGATGPLETFIQLISSLPHGAAGAGEGAAIAMGETEATGRKWGRALGAGAEYFTNELVGTGFHPPYGRAIGVARLARDLDVAIPEAAKAIRAGESYLKAGELPPPGTHPVWDGVIAENVKQGMSVYDALVDAADRSDTIVSSQELMRVAAEQGLKNVPVYLHWDAVKNLYGDKLPEPGDGKLGDVPGVAEQFQRAIEDRTDIRMNMPEWIAYVSKELRKELHDDVRIRQTDPTVNEVKDFPTITEAINNLKPKEEPKVELTPQMMKDAGLTDSEMRNVSESQAQQINEGHGWIGGSWRKITGEDVASAKENARLEAEQKVKDLEKFEAAIEAVKDDPNKYPRFSMLGSDWQFHLHGRPQNKEGYIAGAREALETKYRHGVWNAARLERIHALSNRKPATEPVINPEPFIDPGMRMAALRREYDNELKLRSPADPLIKALRAISGYEWHPEEISKAVTWAHLNNRPDIVQRALEMSKLTDPQVYARLETELYELQRREAAQKAVNKEVNPPMLSIEDWTHVDITSDYVPEFKTIDELRASGEGWIWMGGHTVMKVTPEFLEARDQIKAVLAPLLKKMVPEGTPLLAIGEQIRFSSREDVAPTGAQGMYLTFQELDPNIIVSLNALDRAGTLAHEVVHHLRTYNYFSKQEWRTLADASKREWIKKHGVATKGYDKADLQRLIEEGVAHEYQEWFVNKNSYPPDTIIGKVFHRIAEFFENARIALKALFGGRLTEEEIFQSIASGRIGSRGPGEPLYGLATKDIREAPSLFPPETPKIEAEGPAFLGLLPKDRYARWQKLYDAANAKNVDKLFAAAAKEAKKRLTPEWKNNYAEQYKQSIEDIKNRPDFRAAAFFRTGWLGDTKLDALPKLDPTFLTEEQKSQLPQKWLRVKDGFQPDQLAHFFGYAEGGELVDALVKLENAKGRMKPETFLDLTASQETERRMTAKYGDLDENILKEAREHAIGLERFDLMHEEYLALGMKLGQEMPLSKKDLKDQAWHQFNESNNTQVSIKKYFADLARSNKATEKAFLAGDALGAFVERQHALRLEALASLAKKFEKKQASMARFEKRYSTREVADHPPEFTNWIHHIMNRIGLEIRDPTDLQIQIDKHLHKNFKEFVDSRKFDGLPDDFELVDGEWDPTLPVWEKLVEEPDWVKHKDALTVGEFEAIHDTIQALDRVGRRELMTVLEGAAVDRDAVLNKMVQQFEAIGKEGLPEVGDTSTIKEMKLNGLRLHAGLIQMEYIWSRVDKKTYGGVFWKAFTKPFSEAGNEYRILIRDYSRALTKLGKETIPHVGYLWRKVESGPLMEPMVSRLDPEGKPIYDRPLNRGYISRGAFRTAMLYMGLDTGLEKAARGYHATPEDFEAWVNKNATKEDWAFVRGVWKLFDELQEKSDLVAMNMHGVTMKREPLRSIKGTIVGDIDGGYYPMIYDQARGGGGKGGKIDPNLPSNVRILTDRGWEKQRTNYIGPISFKLSHMGYQMTRHIRDIAFREVLTESQKYFKNKKFTDAMTKHMGQHYTELLIPYLRDIAGVRGPTSGFIGAAETFQNVIIQNTIGLLVGWNPGTVMKHTSTAYIQSLKELKNPANLAAATKDLYANVPSVTKANHKFIDEGGMVGKLDWKGSAEIQGRRPNWFEAFGGASDIVSGKSTMKARLGQAYSAWIARSDQAASKALWLAKYREMMEEFKSQMTVEKAHTEAVAIADQSVRRTHGSTAITSRPAMMRNPWLNSFTALYGFFNHTFNRMWEMSWQGRDMIKDAKKGEATLSDLGHLASSFFYVIAVPAVVEELVTPLFDDEERSLGVRFLAGLGFPVASSYPVIREIAHAVLHNKDPAAGILSASYKTVTDFSRVIKQGKFDVDTFGDTLQATNALLGMATGLTTGQIGRWEKFAWNYLVAQSEQPQTADEWYRAFRYGTSKERRH